MRTSPLDERASASRAQSGAKAAAREEYLAAGTFGAQLDAMDTHIYRCAACGGMNRVPTSRLNQAPNCGRCKKRLALENAPFDVDDAGLATLVAKSPVPVLVDFWAPWCAPCRAVAPHLVQLGQRKAGRMLIAKINTQNHPRTAAALQVKAIPTLAIWKGGHVVEQQAGARMGLQLDELVDPYL